MSAWADCPAAPINYDATDCVVDATTVCSTTSTTFTCDVSWSDEDAEVTIVSDYDTAIPYEAWGEVNGELFCCNSNPQYTPSAVHIEGSYYADILSYTGSSLAYNLNGVGTAIAATIDGNDGPDQINGSHASGANIAETLNGGTQNDTIRGNADADTCNGNEGDDLMLGGSGDDTMNGHDGSDEMLGGAGNDIMNGNDGRDFMSGGSDNDTMNGGLGGDVLCGEGESGVDGDILDDGDSDDEGAGVSDVLWSSINPDEAYCNDGSTKWDGNAGVNTCSGNATISTPPPECP